MRVNTEALNLDILYIDIWSYQLKIQFIGPIEMLNFKLMDFSQNQMFSKNLAFFIIIPSLISLSIHFFSHFSWNHWQLFRIDCQKLNYSSFI